MKLFWPFRRKPKINPPADQRVWNEDWRAGDLAECLHGVWLFTTPYDPKAGDVLRVAGAVEGVSIDGAVLVYALSFEDKPAGHAWATQGFRKLRPSLEAADERFVAELRERLREVQPS